MKNKVEILYNNKANYLQKGIKNIKEIHNNFIRTNHKQKLYKSYSCNASILLTSDAF